MKLSALDPSRTVKGADASSFARVCPWGLNSCRASLARHVRRVRICRSVLVSTGYGVALGAEILGQIGFHLEGGFVGHGVEVLEVFREQVKAELFDVVRTFDAGFVFFEAFFG